MKTVNQNDCCLSLNHSNHSIENVLLGIDQSSPVAIHRWNISLEEKRTQEFQYLYYKKS